MPLVGLITIWYKAEADIARFVANLGELGYANIQHVFVIHALEAQAIQQLRAEVPMAILLEPGRNLGTAAGWNLGIRRLLEARADYIGIWNVDVTLNAGSIANLVDLMEQDRSIGAACPLLFYSDEPTKVQMYGGGLNIETGNGKHEYNGWTDLKTLPSTRDATYLDGGTMLMRAAVLRQVGTFDEKYFMYAEDADLSLRIRSAGYRTVAMRDAWAWHFHRQKWGRLPAPYELFYLTRNRFYFVRKHAGVNAWQRLAVETITGCPRRLLYFLRRRKLILARAYAAAVIYGAIGLMGKRGWSE